MSIESKINYQLNKYPAVKKVVKRAYQRVMYAVSPKIKSEGDIVRVSPDDPNHEYFFGYYDKSPWDITDRYMLCLKANDTWSDVSPKAPAEIILIDTQNNNKAAHLARTHAWNVQQSCMLQWLGPDFKDRVIFNDFRNGKYCSVILKLDYDGKDVTAKEEKVISAPVYSVSEDGSFALTLDFSRLYNLRPGYGYYNVPEKTKGIALPDASAIWKVDLVTGEVSSLLKYTDFANFEPRPEMKEKGSVHKVNHIMLSPNGKRFMVLYRWFNGQRKYTRLITCNIDGTDMYVLSDDDMVSHCYWKNDCEILAFENKKDSGPGYYLMQNKTQKYIHCWPQFSNDGHPSYSPDRSLIVTDSYPNRARVASINLMDGNEEKKENTTIARVFAPFKYDNDTRCDLHPRWNRKGDKICFDSVFEGHRGLYTVAVPKNRKTSAQKKNHTINAGAEPDIKYSLITPVYNSFDLMGRFFDSLARQTYKNFEVIFVDDCSTDGSYEKLIEYQKTSPFQMTVMRAEKNMGPGNARNMGIEAATGEWITFLDNDDWVERNFLERITDVIHKEHADCVIYDYYIQREGREKMVAKSVIAAAGGHIPTAKCVMSVTNHTIGKFYKLANCVENNIKFPLTRRCEDVAFTILAVSVCKDIFYLEEPLYYYYQRAGSLSNNTKLDEQDMVKAFAVLQERLEKQYPQEIKEKSIRDLLYGCVLMMCKAGKSNGEIKAYIDRYETKYPDWYQCGMVRQVGKAKRVFLVCIKHRQVGALKALSYLHTKLVTG